MSRIVYRKRLEWLKRGLVVTLASISKLLSETLTLTDELWHRFAGQISDSFSFMDSVAVFMENIVNLFETLSLSDSFVGRMWGTITESLSLADTALKKYIKTAADGFDFSDSVTRHLTTLKQETLSLGDTLYSRLFRKPLSEALHLGDSLIRRFRRVFSDSFLFTDSVGCSRTCCQVCEACQLCVVCYACDLCMNCDAACYSCVSCQGVCYTCDIDDPCLICEVCYRCNATCFKCYTCNVSCYTCQICNVACYNCNTCQICVTAM